MYDIHERHVYDSFVEGGAWDEGRGSLSLGSLTVLVWVYTVYRSCIWLLKWIYIVGVCFSTVKDVKLTNGLDVLGLLKVERD